MRWPGSRECGAFLPLEDERIQQEHLITSGMKNFEVGNKLVRRGIRKYVTLRTVGFRWEFRRRRPTTMNSSTPRRSMGHEYHPSQFRYTPPPTKAPEQLPTKSLEAPDFELWINELWHDFLIEPTPYLVASAITYLGFFLLFVEYYSAIWQLSCFFLRFIPWDDEFGLR